MTTPRDPLIVRVPTLLSLVNDQLRDNEAAHNPEGPMDNDEDKNEKCKKCEAEIEELEHEIEYLGFLADQAIENIGAASDDIAQMIKEAYQKEFDRPLPKRYRRCGG